jgi:hypothetical protein
MRQAVMTEPAIIVFEDVPKPIPGKGQVLVRVIGVRGIYAPRVPSFWEEPAQSVILVRFLRLLSRHGGSLSSPASEAHGPLPGDVPSFRALPGGV